MSRESVRSVASMSATAVLLVAPVVSSRISSTKMGATRPFRQAVKCGRERIAPATRHGRSAPLSWPQPRTIVTGPSLTSSTLIRAPKTPVCDRDAVAGKGGAEALDERLRDLGPGGVREAGPVALAGVGEQRELAHDEDLAARVEHRAVELPVVRCRRCEVARPSRPDGPPPSAVSSVRDARAARAAPARSRRRRLRRRRRGRW